MLFNLYIITGPFYLTIDKILEMKEYLRDIQLKGIPYEYIYLLIGNPC